MAPPAAPTLLLTATPPEVEVGLSAVLRWSSTYASQCTASGGWVGSRAVAGSESVQPPEGRTQYRLRCTGAGGSVEAVVEVLGVAPPPPPPAMPTVQLSTSHTRIEVGEFATLAWSSTDASSCLANGSWNGSRAPAGSQSVQPVEGLNHYVLQCSGEGGSSEAAVDITGVVTPPPPTLPTLRLSASPLRVEVGSPSLLSWSSSDARACTASEGWSGSRATAGNESLLPPEGLSRYRLSCDGDGGSAEALVEILGIVTPPPKPEAELEFERIRDLEQGCCETP